MSADTLRRVRAATTKHGLLLVAHANALDMQRMAVDGNVDMILHGVWNWNELDNAEGIPPAIDALTCAASATRRSAIRPRCA